MRTTPAEDVNVRLDVHHVRPFGLGGLTEEQNLLTLCQTCHTGLDPHFEWQLLGMIPDGLVMPTADAEFDGETFGDDVRRYREIARAQMQHLGRCD